ncbi:MAG: CHAT domain-containing protein [Chloroflexi bacterium]|nr:MAG: CHAT domain-containing protein [Chloroflexota bacterium]
MKIEGLVEQFLGERISPQILSTPLPDDIAAVVVERLKQEADRYWYIDYHRSLELANRIVTIGERRQDAGQTALGLMARGDALKLLGDAEAAWVTLDEAGKLFQTIGDEVGWARTRIGRVYLSTTLNYVPEALADARLARTIFTDHREHERLLRLDLNTALVHSLLGDQFQALRLYHSALAIAETLGETGEQYLGPLHIDIGLAHESLGDFSQALTYYERARAIHIGRNETLNIAVSELNIAYIAQARGHYRRALRLLYGMLERGIEEFPVEYLAVKRDMIECFLHLNRYADARELARQIIGDYRKLGATHDTARNLLHLATAEAELNNFEAARAALEEAEPIFTSLGAATWMATTQLRRGRIALKQGDSRAAYEFARAAADCFERNGQQISYATAILLQGQAQFALGDARKASQAAAGALQIAQRFNVPALRYATHLLLGQVSNSQYKKLHAARHYQAAIATLERVQRGLTITLRPGFLEDKGEASRNLIALHLERGQAERAFDALERAKSQVLLSYLANREQFRWAQSGNSRTQGMIEELNKLRAEHQWFYRLAHEPHRNTERPNTVQPEQALREVAVRERRMRSITEQLYLHSGDDYQANQIAATSLKDIQHTLSEGTVLIEFYDDDSGLWVFILDGHTIHVQRLPATTAMLNQLLAQLRGNIAAALKVDSQSAAARNLSQLARRILKRLHSLLIEPLMLHRYNPKKLTIVPYGALHYLPFHILYDGSEHLIQKHEVVVWPAAGLATQPALKRDPGALILANSWEGRLPHVFAEAQMVQRLFGGTLCSGEAANRAALQTPPTQILHIATHGEHRLDQPDLSYLQLAEGQLYADDMLQQDMSYELVTLSACETGRANVAAGDELIGLGRGFLYAGAGALLVSLWQVADTSTLYFMERMYKALRSGTSKAAAMREAQQFMLVEEPWHHPAFWGAFQLIGNDRPLSSSSERI